MIRRIERADGPRWQVYGREGKRKVYVGTYESEDQARSVDVVHKANKRAADSRIVAFKLYAIHENQAESLLVHDTFIDGDRVYDLGINGRDYGLWMHARGPGANETASAREVLDACRVLFDAHELGADGLPLPQGVPF